jgi:hypothetical protein
MTVGTSLLTNDGGNERREGDCKELNEAACALRNRPCLPNLRSGVLAHLRQLCPAYEVGLRSKTDPVAKQTHKDRLPQELSYLRLLLAGDGECHPETHVVLIPSYSAEGEACASIIRDYLQPSDPGCGWPGVQCVEVVSQDHVAGLQVQHEVSFRTEGIPNLVKVIRQKVTGEAWDEVIINLTGGFKGVIPFVTLSGLFLDRPDYAFHYLFEDTANILRLPSFPVGLDFPLWHREAALLDAARTHPRLYTTALDPRMTAICEAGSEPPDGSLSAVMEERYRKQRDTDPLQEFSRRVIKQFVTDDNLKNTLLDLLPRIGPLLWMGDKLPMAADHAARHHHNLLEFAQLLLTPILKGHDSFLNQKERFVLLAALMLHDCGHTLDALKTKEGVLVPLFPSEIRKYHHFLSYRRVTDKQLAEAMGWSSTHELAKAVAWLVFHHRKQTGWEKCGKACECPFWSPEPAKSSVHCADRRFTKLCIGFGKLVALLRIIDGCDNQSRRVGPRVQSDLMQKLFAHDALTHKEQVRRLLPLIGGGTGSPCHADDRSAFLEQCQLWIADKAEAPAIPWKVRESLASEASPEAAAWTAIAREVDEFHLRHRQFAHFLKHNGVLRVELRPGNDFCEDQNWSFNVILHPDHELVDDNGRLLLDSTELAENYKGDIDDKETFRQWIWEEVAGEFGQSALNCIASAAGRKFGLKLMWKGDSKNAKNFVGEPKA